MSLLKEDLWSIPTDPLCVFRGCSGSRHLSCRVIHQSSMSSYTSSSKGRAEDGCSLWREYLSWRRSPTSLMTFSACGDIYTMKKKKKCCQSEGQHEERGRLQMQRHQTRKTKLQTGAEAGKISGLNFYIFHLYYLGVRAKWWVHTDTSSKQQQLFILSKALQPRGTYSLWVHELWLMQRKCYSSSCYSIRSTIITQCRHEYILLKWVFKF